jgi:hypothetical protein
MALPAWSEAKDLNQKKRAVPEPKVTSKVRQKV